MIPIKSLYIWDRRLMGRLQFSLFDGSPFLYIKMTTAVSHSHGEIYLTIFFVKFNNNLQNISCIAIFSIAYNCLPMGRTLFKFLISFPIYFLQIFFVTVFIFLNYFIIFIASYFTITIYCIGQLLYYQKFQIFK